MESYYRAVANIKTIDYLEVGYFSPLNFDSYKGQYYNLTYSEIEAASQLSKKMISVMINSREWDIDTFRDLLTSPKINYVDLLRFAVDPDKIENYLSLFKECEARDIEYALNIMYASKWDNFDFCEIITESELSPKFIYIVDSYGGLLPSELNLLLDNLAISNIDLGFHAHDNMTLAFANSLVAKMSGVKIIDSTWLGMGRGSGNLCSENWATYLGERSTRYIVEILKLFRPLKQRYQWGTSYEYFVSGSQNYEQSKVMDMVTSGVHSTETVINRILSNEIGDKMNRFDLKSIKKAKNVLIVGNAVKLDGLSKKVISKLFKRFDLVISIVNANITNELIRSLSNQYLVIYNGDTGFRISDNRGYYRINSKLENESLNALDLSISIADKLCSSDIYVFGIDGYEDLATEYKEKIFNKSKSN